MTFDFSWLQVRDLDAEGRWHDVGVLLRGGGELSFHPRLGFEVTTVTVVNGAARATARGTVDETWDYLQDRALGGYSTFSDPGSMEGDDRAAVAERLLKDAGKIQASD